MDSSVQVAIVAAVGGIIGAVVKALAPDLKVLLAGKARSNSDLIGTWDCAWFIRQTTGKEELAYDDIIKISKVWGEKLSATGVNTKYGDYKITGRVSRSSLVTLHYEGDDERQSLGGVVIMKLRATRDEMNGYWYEYGTEEKIAGGRADWKKRKK